MALISLTQLLTEHSPVVSNSTPARLSNESNRPSATGPDPADPQRVLVRKIIEL